MIRELRIEGWRAFDRLTLTLDAGVTFVVAENGIGKTSLIQAAGWGLYGSLSGVDAAAARRFGQDQLSVEVDLELPDGRLATVRRALGGRTESLRAAVGDTELDDDGLAILMADAFGASREFLSRTTMLPSSAVADHSLGLAQLHQHLCHVFGVDDLRAAADALARTHAAAAADAKRYRQQDRRTAADLTALREQLTALDEALVAVERGRARAAEAASAARDVVERLKAVQAAGQRDDRDRVELEQIRARIRALAISGSEPTGAAPAVAPDAAAGGRGVGRLDDPFAATRAELDRAEAEATQQLDTHRAELAMVSARMSAARAAAGELHDAGGECPVCRRPLSPADLAAASTAHEQSTATLLQRDTELRAAVTAHTERLQNIRVLIGQAARLRAPTPLPLPSTVPSDGDIVAATEDLEQARVAEARWVDRAAEARVRRDLMAQRVSDEESTATLRRRSQLAHRREAVANIAAQVMSGTANAVLTERIDPLVTEITHRWKRVFVNRGELRLQHDGRLVLLRGSHHIDFDQFSSGEKVIALLATRLLVLEACTKASFLWLDEPLEHLDPRNRRLAASLMATAGDHTRQLLVTTYEDQLARNLARDGATELRYVRSAS
ncbi:MULTISPECIES: AAA family ATPase [unclassified Mycobacterium]|uniref:AAA family ATPase n=1 Tax=unclassified Mycobacterium TaxID=2642494 RepID=UPI0029C72535|nr:MULTISPECIES: AAA family ATPase [unclassified Mycobacterium]